MNKRNYNFDLVKGILIIFVVIGHLIPGVLRDTFSRYLIYAFHMPVFIGISGYLLNVDTLKEMKIVDLLKKYWIRIILPWIIAVNIYYIITNLFNQNISMIGYLKAYIYPYYHLWFIIGFLAYILITWSIFKVTSTIKINQLICLMIGGIIISLIFQFVQIDSKLYNLVQHSVRLYNYIFFGLITKMCA